MTDFSLIRRKERDIHVETFGRERDVHDMMPTVPMKIIFITTSIVHV